MKTFLTILLLSSAAIFILTWLMLFMAFIDDKIRKFLEKHLK